MPATEGLPAPGALVMLRRLTMDDADALVAYRSDPEVARYQSWTPDWSVEDARRLVEGQPDTDWPDLGDWLQLAIVERASGALVGDLGIHSVATQPRTIELGITLAGDRQGRGFASEAVRLVLAWLFEERNQHRVLTQSDERNPALHRLVEHLGFRREATLVEADWFEGAWTTLVVHAILEREWSGG
ncbi:MAG: GNAT family protein [Actinomycetota bacterium]|nr:GNAT family protein [Actinomycetota bacterium]